jgi:hypothetical protein
MKQDILNRLNEIILEEKGTPVTINSMWSDANLDSLGTVMSLAVLESEYPIFKDIPPGTEALTTLDFKTLTIRELVKKCVLSNTNTSSEQK